MTHLKPPQVLAIISILILAGCGLVRGPFKESDIPLALDRDDFIRTAATRAGLQIQGLGSGGTSGRGQYPATTKRKISVTVAAADVNRLFPRLSEEVKRTLESYEAKIISSGGSPDTGNISYKYKWASNNGRVDLKCKATSQTDAEIELVCEEQR